jgi:hypothetical protein
MSSEYIGKQGTNNEKRRLSRSSPIHIFGTAAVRPGPAGDLVAAALIASMAWWAARGKRLRQIHSQLKLASPLLLKSSIAIPSKLGVRIAGEIAHYSPDRASRTLGGEAKSCFFRSAGTRDNSREIRAIRVARNTRSHTIVVSHHRIGSAALRHQT